MKPRFTEEQIIGILNQAEASVKVNELCRQHNVTEQTYYREMNLSELRHLKELEQGNSRLKKPGGRSSNVRRFAF